MGVPERDPLAQLSLPPGFRFYPTDEELLVQYLCRKVAGQSFSIQIIGEIDLYKFDPWHLPSKALFGEKEWYFFSPRDRKYPNGSRPNRVAGSGYWKATGTDKVITTEGRRVGIKKALVFYVGKAPKGTKTNWIMHEYRLIDQNRKYGGPKLDDWVLCRIYKKNSSAQKLFSGSTSLEEYSNNGSSSSSSSHIDDVLESLPDIDEKLLNLPRMNSLKRLPSDVANVDWATLAGISTAPALGPSQGKQDQGLVPSMPPLCHVKIMEDEVQSGLRNHKADGGALGFWQQDSGWLTRGFSGNFADLFGPAYLVQPSGFGLRY